MTKKYSPFYEKVYAIVRQIPPGTVTSYGPPASHHLRWLASANCLLEIDEDVTELSAGERVTVWDLHGTC